jgi:hypothetical protein
MSDDVKCIIRKVVGAQRKREDEHNFYGGKEKKL